jgi:hypothetical protein
MQIVLTGGTKDIYLEPCENRILTCRTWNRNISRDGRFSCKWCFEESDKTTHYTYKELTVQ